MPHTTTELRKKRHLSPREDGRQCKPSSLAVRHEWRADDVNEIGGADMLASSQGVEDVEGTSIATRKVKEILNHLICSRICGQRSPLDEGLQWSNVVGYLDLRQAREDRGKNCDGIYSCRKFIIVVNVFAADRRRCIHFICGSCDLVSMIIPSETDCTIRHGFERASV